MSTMTRYYKIANPLHHEKISSNVVFCQNYLIRPGCQNQLGCCCNSSQVSKCSDPHWKHKKSEGQFVSLNKKQQHYSYQLLFCWCSKSIIFSCILFALVCSVLGALLMIHYIYYIVMEQNPLLKISSSGTVETTICKIGKSFDGWLPHHIVGKVTILMLWQLEKKNDSAGPWTVPKF